MDPTTTSTFDLSPTEKLQLVEDLWDDLAPEAVPIHDWQRKELARREANLREHPKTGLAWEQMERPALASWPLSCSSPQKSHGGNSGDATIPRTP